MLQEPNAILDKNNITASEEANPTVSEEDDILNSISEENGILCLPKKVKIEIYPS